MAVKRKTTRRSTAKKPLLNKQQQKIAIVGGGIGIAALLASKMARAQKMPPVEEREIYSTDNLVRKEPVIPGISPTVQPLGFPLKVGSSGNYVKDLQRVLLKRGGSAANFIRSSSVRPNGDEDGIIGNGTQRAVLAAGIPYPVSYSAFKNIV